MPEFDGFTTECRDGEDIRRHGVVVGMTLYNSRLPLPLNGNGLMTASHEFGFHLFQLRSHPFPNRVSDKQEFATSRRSANMREPQKVKCFRPPKPLPLAVFSREAAEFDEASLVLVQIEPELGKSFAECVPEALGFNSMLEANHNVISKAYDDDVTVCLRSAPMVGP